MTLRTTPGASKGITPVTTLRGAQNGGQRARAQCGILRRLGPRWVISLGGDWGRGPVYVRSASNRVEILCTAVKDAKCQEPTYAVQQIAAYSITSSAIASNPGGMVRASALCVRCV